MPATERTPLFDRQGLPLPIGSGLVQDHPIFLRVCHSPWPFLSQSSLVYIRAALVTYLTALIGMLLDYEINWREKDDDYTPWRIIFQFSTLSFALLWLYHLIVFAWSFTHLYYPDLDEDDNRWESVVLSAMSPPTQTAQTRKRFYFSLFYTIVHVFALMNVLIFWTILVPNGHGHLPQGEGEESGLFSAFGAVEDFFTSEGWFPPFCVLNLWGVTGIIATLELLVLSSVKRQVPVPSHVFIIVFFLGWYLGWAAIGYYLTEYPPFFWMDREEMGKTEIVAAYAAGFISMGPAVFSSVYGLIGMRENLTGSESGGSSQAEPEPQIQTQPEEQDSGDRFANAVNFAQGLAHQAQGAAQQVQEEFQRVTGKHGKQQK